MFHQLIVSCAHSSRTHKPWTVAVSAMGQVLLLGLLILVPLMYTEALPDAMLRTMLVAPLPPQPPQLPPRVRTDRRPRVIPLRNIVQPTHIPPHVLADTDAPVIYEEAIAEPGGVSDSFLSMPVQPPARLPAPVEERRVPVPIGGAIEEASLIHKVVPEYPAIAKTARVSGTVALHAIIATDGAVKQLAYISGPPLLISAALNAVRQWRYTPTLLNGTPVEVDTTIQVVFNLAN